MSCTIMDAIVNIIADRSRYMTREYDPSMYVNLSIFLDCMMIYILYYIILYVYNVLCCMVVCLYSRKNESRPVCIQTNRTVLELGGEIANF